MKYLVFVLFTLLSICSFAQPALQWNQTFPLDSNSVIFSTYNTALGFNNNIIIGSVALNDDLINDYDPLVIAYDNAGNLIFNWVNNDSSLNEFNTVVNVDSLGFIYVMTDGYEYASGASYTSIVKLNPITSQEEFRLSFIGSWMYSNFIMDENFIYLIQPKPQNLLHKIDLQGNIIQTYNLPWYFRYTGLKASDQNLYIVGDTINLSTNAWLLRISKLNKNGLLLNDYIDSYDNIFFKDLIVNDDDILTYTGDLHNSTLMSSDIIVYQFDSLFFKKDTIIPIQGSNRSLAYNNIGEVFMIFSNANTSETIRLFQPGVTTPFFIADSALTNNWANYSLHSLPGGNFITFNSLDDSGFNDTMMYHINCFDVNGNLNWSYNHQPNNLNYSKKSYYVNGNLYCIGATINFTGNYSINVFKISVTTGLLSQVNSDQIVFYPNPATSRNINFIKPVSGIFTIYSLSGQSMWSETLDDSNSIQFPSQLASGMYVVKLKTKSGESQGKICIME